MVIPSGTPAGLPRALVAGMSRRQFMRVTVAGIAGFELLRAGPAFSTSTAAPKPIPGGLKLTESGIVPVPADPDLHILPPAVGFEMSSITDFTGTVGAADIQGAATGSDGSSYGFDADMRFMQGEYVGEDGNLHHGTFGFVWIDLFTGAVGDPTAQVHDFEPGIAASGLFWTIAIPDSAVDASPGSGRARYRVENLAVPDFHDFFNAISPSHDPAPLPSHVSFEVTWLGGGDRQSIRDTVFDFGGEFVPGDATISFTASNDGTGVTYSSVAEGQTTVSAGVGHERNGRFFN